MWIKQFENPQSNMVETHTNRYLLVKIHGRSLSWLVIAFSIKNWWAQTSFIRPNISSYWIDTVMLVIIFNGMHSIRNHRATEIVICIILVMKFTNCLIFYIFKIMYIDVYFQMCCYDLSFGSIINSFPYAGGILSSNPFFDLVDYNTYDVTPWNDCCIRSTYCRFFYRIRPMGSCYRRSPFRGGI